MACLFAGNAGRAFPVDTHGRRHHNTGPRVFRRQVEHLQFRLRFHEVGERGNVPSGKGGGL